MSLTNFSEPRVRDNFRVKICFDTNILNYYLNNEYPSLNRALEELFTYTDFLDLVTTRYVLFELLEVRKRDFFRNKAATGFPHLQPLNESHIRKFNVPNQTSPFYYTLLPTIVAHIQSELDILRNHSDIAIDGTIHDKLWAPTADICLNTRLNREDSLVLTSTLMPDDLRVEEFLTVFTNDKDFHDFFHEAPNLNQIFSNHSLHVPLLSYIQNLTNFLGTKCNLTDSSTLQEVPRFILSYIKTLIIEKNKSLFIGKTDISFSTRIPDIIGIRFLSTNQIPSASYLTIIGNNLDFIVNCPVRIADFRNSASNSIQFPISHENQRIVFKWPLLNPDDPLKAIEPNILAAIKSSDNLVFLHPDSI